MKDQPIYNPLPRQASIRLLKIAPGYPQDDIVCELVVVDSLEHGPSYEALSYAWGDPSVTVPITCNGVSKSVTTNLAAALRRLRRLPEARTVNRSLLKGLLQSRSKLRTLREANLPSFAKWVHCTDQILSAEGLIWIDALSINQEDLAEKSAQVALMPDIYQGAARVVVWLGDHTSDTVAALNMLSIGLDGYYRERPPGVEKYLPRSEPLLRDINKLRGFPDIGPTSASWIALSRFFRRPWFSRNWIIQEVALSRSCVMFAGDIEIDWRAVGRASYWMESKGYGGVALNVTDKVAVHLASTVWEIQAAPRQTELSFLLSRTNDFHASLPQDKIYSLLALAIKIPDPARQPDYSKPAVDVFRAVVKSIIEEEQNLSVLAQVVHGPNCLDQGSSWVPTWVHRSETADLGVNKFDMFRADMGKKLTLDRSQEIEILCLDGISFDTITFYTDIVTEYIDSSHNAQQKQLWDAIKQKAGGALTSYIGGGSTGIAFTQVLTQGVDQNSQLVNENSEYYLDAAAYWRKLGANDLQIVCQQETDALKHAQKIEAGRIGHHDPFIVATGQATFGRRIFLTATGYLGVGPAAMIPGDQVCVLYGSSHPFVLRAQQDKHQLVGACYVQGIMHGEAIEQLEAEIIAATRTFALV